MKNQEVALEVQESTRVPIWHKLCLTVEEASIYSGIGEKRIRELLNDRKCLFCITKGTHKMVKRKQFEDFIDKCNTL